MYTIFCSFAVCVVYGLWTYLRSRSGKPFQPRFKGEQPLGRYGFHCAIIVSAAFLVTSTLEHFVPDVESVENTILSPLDSAGPKPTFVVRIEQGRKHNTYIINTAAPGSKPAYKIIGDSENVNVLEDKAISEGTFKVVHLYRDENSALASWASATYSNARRYRYEIHVPAGSVVTTATRASNSVPFQP